MLLDLYRWWIGQLVDCVPQRWRHAVSSTEDRLTITPVGSVGICPVSVSVSIWSRNREAPLGQFPVAEGGLVEVPTPPRLPVVLRLPDSDVLCKTIALPLATERDLVQVLSFEMDRETPFATEEVLWAHRIVERDKQRGQLVIRLRLVSRALLAPLFDALTDNGIFVTRTEIAGGADDGLVLPLETAAGRAERRSGRERLRWASAAICLAFAVIAVAAPFIRQARDVARLDQEIASGRGAADQAQRLRHDIDRLEGAGDVVKKERAAAGDPLAVLAALTAALPDDTYLTELQQQEHKVTFGGRSAAASRLIGAVAKSDELHNPVFAAPVTRMEATHQEVFSITAETGR